MGTRLAGGDKNQSKAEFEYDAVRVLRIDYGAGEESVIHYQPDNFAIIVTDHRVETGLPDGSAQELAADFDLADGYGIVNRFDKRVSCPQRWYLRE
jgi:hypothetical protein